MLKDHTPYVETFAFAAEYVTRAVKEYVRRIIKENNFDVPYDEYLILDTIIAYPGMIQMEIAKKLFVQRSYLSKLLVHLEENGYIKRVETIKGKRQVIFKVYATEKGEQEHEKMVDAFRKFFVNRGIVTRERMKEITNDLFYIANSFTELEKINL